MTIKYGFYNSVNGDRAYNANDMSSLFEGVFHDGVFFEIGNAMGVATSTGMGVTVMAGRAWFNTTWTEVTEAFRLALDGAHAVYGRIDVIALEIDKSDAVRANTIKVIKGTPSSSPVAPTLTNSGTLHQYPLAHITVGANVTSIVTGNIANKGGTEACPWVKGLLRNIDTVVVDGYVSTLTGMIEDLDASLITNAPLTSNVSYYVATTGNDSNDGLTVGTPFLTINKAISMLPKEFRNNANAEIRIDSGTYNEYPSIKGFYGYGTLEIFGATSPSKPITQNINTDGCSLTSINVYNLDPNGITVQNSTRVTYDGLKCDAVSVNFVDSTLCYCMNCSFNGADPCIHANRGSTVIIVGNSGSTSGKVLEANYGGTIVKVGSVGITGGTAETVSNGGLIR
jgi:hypothetical protein